MADRHAARDDDASPGAAAPSASARVPSRAFRVANSVLAALFLFGALVQWNDPDPLPWMAIYAGAAVAALLAGGSRPTWRVAGLVGVVALLWAAALGPGALGGVRMGELVEGWEMKDTRIEEGRETYGLLLIAGWMTVLTVRGLRDRRRPRALSPPGQRPPRTH